MHQGNLCGGGLGEGDKLGEEGKYVRRGIESLGALGEGEDLGEEGN